MTANAAPVATAWTTELPQSAPDPRKRLAPVLAASGRRRDHISEIDVPLARYPRLANTFCRFPIMDPQPAMRVVYSAGATS